MNRLTLILILLASAALPAAADTTAGLAQSVTAEDGRVHLSFPARESIRVGDGNVTITDDGDVIVGGGEYTDGLVHVTLRVRDGAVDRLDVRSNHRPSRHEREARDLGEVEAALGAAYLLEIARNTDETELAEDAITAAALVDTETWPELAVFARDRDRAADVRETAIFWLGQAASDKVSRELEAIVADDSEEIDIREHAVFALHQAVENDTAHAIETLGRIATENPHPQVRRSALFWLAQVDDPAVVDLFEAILLN